MPDEDQGATDSGSSSTTSLDTSTPEPSAAVCGNQNRDEVVEDWTSRACSPLSLLLEDFSQYPVRKLPQIPKYQLQERFDIRSIEASSFGSSNAASEPTSSKTPQPSIRFLNDATQADDNEIELHETQSVMELAIANRKPFFLMLESLRARRRKANEGKTCNRFYQNSNTTNPAGSSSALHKLFDKYRGRSLPLALQANMTLG